MLAYRVPLYIFDISRRWWQIFRKKIRELSLANKTNTRAVFSLCVGKPQGDRFGANLRFIYLAERKDRRGQCGLTQLVQKVGLVFGEVY